MKYKLLHGDCLKKMAEMDDNSVHAIVTDPPYGLSFMSKKWDYDVPSVKIWRETFRVLKPGGFLLSFAGSRTYHRMAVNIEDAGFEIRDQIMWVYGSGFPKSHNISKAIDKAAGVERTEVIGTRHRNVKPFNDEEGWNKNNTQGDYEYKAPATKEAKQWDGWGSALKPAHEPIVVARKPLIGTIVENVLEHGTGGLNIDVCRIEHNDPMITRKDFDSNTGEIFQRAKGDEAGPSAKGRFPANFIHDGSDEVVSQFPDTKGATSRTDTTSTGMFAGGDAGTVYPDSGSAARFFYCAKASKAERNIGLEHLPNVERTDYGGFHSEEGLINNGRNPENRELMKNPHPTVKPVNLMKYLCRLVTPKNGIVLDPFMGSGTTGIAATQEGFNFVGIEMDDEYIKIANYRISHWVEEKQELILEQRRQKTLFQDW